MRGEFPDRDARIALLRRVIDAGVTFIDTADAYGPHTNEILIHARRLTRHRAGQAGAWADKISRSRIRTPVSP